jgi:phosphoglycerate dehydrogenase-like enzyme
LHIENRRQSLWIYHITDELWAAAAMRHKKLAGRLDVTIGWDGDILDAALRTADCMIAPTPPRERLRERAPRLKWIQNRGAGIDHLLPLVWLPSDIALTNNSGAHGAKCEDYCAMAMLMLATRMPGMLASHRAARWEPLFTTPIAGKTALVIGFGDLGSAAGRAAKKLGLKVIAVTRSGKAGRPADAVYKVSRLESALPQADFVVVATPLTPQTRGLLNRDRLALLKPEAGLINVGRAAIVDHDALRDMLIAGRLSGAVLDVHAPEPLPAESPLWTTPNLVVTPHISCDDPRYIDILLDRWFANFARFAAGKPLLNQVDRKLGY